MLGTRTVASGLLAAAMGASLPAVASPPASSLGPSVHPGAVATRVVDSASPGAIALIPAAARRTSVRAVRVRGFGFDVVVVDVNPTLRRKSYRVKLQIRRNGQSETCVRARTHNNRESGYPRTGRKPHDVAYIGVCGDKATKRYRIVVPAQHGFRRTVVPITNWQF